ncbi:lipopolysaccharide transport periplasmic protein LptA [Mesosutterella sp. OilRF-GAM-744-9]|uniref:Lipopolysaccharide export system protein LptA n=1 Tax=Mesosutterella porci TaxID=2915351 RepID=A0ABS9MNP0_9BURK|nr:lipopolysaccharide transport periplasmic protein LptA [Mesosutterella sp. oilRF-744-WT-GAM-9]MCG5030237.1 lipopolysaccharide transport periplasmic protein LptA [Mesosutterella sp. oilRF-744-WT-GAM-9]
MLKNKIILIAATGFAAAAVQALQSDSSKPIEIAADRFSGDQVQQTAIYTGNVEVHQGSLEMHGDRMDLSVNKKGYRTGVMTGRQARFKQQRDNPDPRISEWMHAQADKMIYNEEKDTITLITNARLTRTENGVLKDEATGQLIVYDIRNARSQAQGGMVSGERQRVTTIIAPRKKDNESGSSAKDTTGLRSSDSIGARRKE